MFANVASAVKLAASAWDYEGGVSFTSLAVVIVGGGIVHAMLIEGTMETISKAALCALVLGAAAKIMADLVWRKRATPRGEA